MCNAAYCKTENVCVRLIFAYSRIFGRSQKLSVQIFLCSIDLYTLTARNPKIHFRKIMSQAKTQRSCSQKCLSYCSPSPFFSFPSLLHPISPPLPLLLSLLYNTMAVNIGVTKTIPLLPQITQADG